MLLTCPNARCRAMHDDGTARCDQCGAPMNRKPDAPQDVNAHLFGLRANAGAPSYAGGPGRVPANEPNYADTRAVKEVAMEFVLSEMPSGN